MRISWLPLLLLAGGCDLDLFADGFRLRDPACGHHVPELARGLTFHLLQSEEGVFDYQPDGATLINISGEYDFDSGDFSWVEMGSAASWVKTIAVEGYGYASQDGDLDIIGDRLITDELEAVERQQFRIERVGCGVERRVRFGAGSFAREMVETGVFRETGYTYTQTRDLGDGTSEVRGTRLADQSYTEEISLDQDDGYTLSATREGSRADGTSTRTFSEVFASGVTRSGTNSVTTDGTRSFDYTQTGAQGSTNWQFTIDYEGNGAGTVTGSGLNCQLTFELGNCTYVCDGGQRGAC